MTLNTKSVQGYESVSNRGNYGHESGHNYFPHSHKDQ